MMIITKHYELSISSITPPVSISLCNELAEIVSWQRLHQSDWYPRPGRTILYHSPFSKQLIKIKGAGFYHPPNIGHSGFHRVTNPIPTSTKPQPPLTQGFCRDLIHVDPDITPPYTLVSVPSRSAPVGGMLLPMALNDQLMFGRLNQAGVPANNPLMVFEYSQLKLEGLPMGVSVSLLPEHHLHYTPYDIYLHWASREQVAEVEQLGAAMTGWANYSIEQPRHRLALISKLAHQAGHLILNFSTKAHLYRLSGSPDNFNMRHCPNSPLYLSDVDTAGDLRSIDPGQHIWEVLRNLLSALHQWLYFFLPALTYRESGYSWELLREYDFIAAMLAGFFPTASAEHIETASAKIWRAIAEVQPLLNLENPIALRRGEHFLQQKCSRPHFYFMALAAIGDLIQSSPVQQCFPVGDTTIAGLDRYIATSIQDPSHQSF
jgi:hypothetical protein